MGGERDSANTIILQSDFFTPMGHARLGIGATPIADRSIQNYQEKASKAEYQNTFDKLEATESQVLGLKAIFDDSTPDIKAPIKALKSAAKDYEKAEKTHKLKLEDIEQSYQKKLALLDRIQHEDIIRRETQALDLEKAHQIEELEREKTLALEASNRAFRAAKETLESLNEKRESTYVLALMLFYYATVLKVHFERYVNIDKIKQYQALADEAEAYIAELDRISGDQGQTLETLKAALSNIEEEKDKKTNNILINAIKEDCQKAYMEVKNGLLRTSKWRDALSAVNLQRIYWIFCHFVFGQLQSMALEIRQHLCSLLGHDLLGNVDDLAKTLDKPKDFLNILSVAIFGIRFVIDIAMIIKHGLNIFATSEERKLPRTKRMWKEFQKRGFDILNNMVWGTANLLTNYNDLFHITGNTANHLIAGLLVFDAVLVQLRYLKAYREYNDSRDHLLKENLKLQKKTGDMKQRLQEVQYILRTQRERVNTKMQQQKQALETSIKDNEQSLNIINHQLNALDDEWEIKKASYRYFTMSAAILCASFCVTLITGVPPLGILVCYLVGTFAVALYLSGDLYTDYKAKKQKYLAAQKQFDKQNTQDHILEQPSPMTEEKLESLKADFKQARRKLAFSLAEKTIVPTILLIAFASNVFVGAGLLTAYLIFKLSIYLYERSKAKKEAPKVNRYSLFDKADDPTTDKEEVSKLQALDKEIDHEDALRNSVSSSAISNDPALMVGAN